MISASNKPATAELQAICLKYRKNKRKCRKIAQSCQVWGYACAHNADALVIVTEWVQVRALDLQPLKREMKQPIRPSQYLSA